MSSGTGKGIRETHHQNIEVEHEANPISHHRRKLAGKYVEEELSKPRFALKKDANHNSVVELLEANGCEVRDCSREGTIPDLLVRLHTECPCFVEIKIPGSKAKWTREQLLFISRTRFDVAIAKDAQEAVFAVKSRQFLAREQKDKLAGYLYRIDKKFYTPAEIEKVLC